MKHLTTLVVYTATLTSFADIATAQDAPLNWSALSQLSNSEVENTARNTLAAQGITTICQLSPNTDALQAQHSTENTALSEAGLLPVPEDQYLIAYFDDTGLKASELLHAFSGPVQSKTQFNAVYVCATNQDARFSAKSQGDHIRVTLHP